MQTCKNEYQLERELHQPYIEHERNSSNPMSSPSWLNSSKPPVSTVYVSLDARWVFGRSAWAPKRSNAPFRVWRVSDWSLVHDGTYEDDGFIDTAAFSQDGNYLAYGSSNRISIYRLNILN